MSRSVGITQWTFTTDAPRRVVAQHLGAAWTAKKYGQKNPIGELADGSGYVMGYEAPFHAIRYSVLISDAGDGARVTTHMHQATTDRFSIMMIPLSKRYITESDAYNGVMKRTMESLRAAGHTVTDQSAPTRFG